MWLALLTFIWTARASDILAKVTRAKAALAATAGYGSRWFTTNEYLSANHLIQQTEVDKKLLESFEAARERGRIQSLCT